MYIKVGAMVLTEGTGVCPIYAEESSSGIYEVFVYDNMGHASYLSNITLSSVREMKESAAVNIIKHFGADGMIMAGDNLVLLKGDKAIVMDVMDNHVVTEVQFDMYTEVEDLVEEDLY